MKNLFILCCGLLLSGCIFPVRVEHRAPAPVIIDERQPVIIEEHHPVLEHPVHHEAGPGGVSIGIRVH